jgi:hypothetical protein
MVLISASKNKWMHKRRITVINFSAHKFCNPHTYSISMDIFKSSFINYLKKKEKQLIIIIALHKYFLRNIVIALLHKQHRYSCTDRAQPFLHLLLAIKE